ncbi:MAG: hypothetical protein NTW55_02915 [Planctomycetota bacterium]|nr:hypothetical protein [Planctomycetota bacterium]
MQKLFLAFIFSFLIPLMAAGDTLPTAEDINNLAKTAKETVDTFMRGSFAWRMEYEYSGKFINKDSREKLRELAQKAGDKLQGIIDSQQQLKSRIEDYTGDDWEERYGSSGLWRTLSSSFYAAILNKCRIGFYLALATGQPQQNEMLNGVLSQINLLNTAEAKFLSADVQILKGQIFAVFSQSEPVYKQLAIDLFDSPAIRSYLLPDKALRIMLERAKLGIEPDRRQLEKLVQDSNQIGLAEDFEFVLPMAFLQHRYDPYAFERLVQAKPQTKDFLSSLVLLDLARRAEQGELTQQAMQEISVFDAEIAVESAWKNQTQDCGKLMECLLSEKKFKTALILYVAGVKAGGSEPQKAVKLLIEASNCQQVEKNSALGVVAEKIASHAAIMSYDLFMADANNCVLATAAFENYFKQQDCNDETVEYLYSSVLNGCGNGEKSDTILQKIGQNLTGIYKNRAKFDIILHEINQKKHPHQKLSEELSKKLNEVISGCDSNSPIDGEVRKEATNLYCQCQVSEGGTDTLADVVERIDQLEANNPDFAEALGNYKKLAQTCFDSLEGQQRYLAGLRMAEFSIFEAGKDSEKLSAVENMLNGLAKKDAGDDADMIRCRARLLTSQRKFEQAAGLWGKLCEMEKNGSQSQVSRSGKWWQGKYFELYCLSKMGQIKKEDLLHCIEVLENSFADIPQFWCEKLKTLKRM